MLKAKHDVWLKNGKEQFVVIPIEEYKTMCERLDDDADFRAIEASKKRQTKSPRTSLEEVKRELGISRNRKKARA